MTRTAEATLAQVASPDGTMIAGPQSCAGAVMSFLRD